MHLRCVPSSKKIKSEARDSDQSFGLLFVTIIVATFEAVHVEAQKSGTVSKIYDSGKITQQEKEENEDDGR